MIVVDHVSKFYGRKAAVQDLDFRIEEGECIGFLGLNGAGKSTTLRLLSCLSLPTSGRITIRGLDAEDQPHEIRKLIGYLPDHPPLYGEMRVDEFLRFAGKLRRMDSDRVKKRLPEVLERTGLERVKKQTIETLSHGYKQRVGIAQAIIHEPSLLILDEPIQGLDPVQIIEMRELIRSLRGEHTILLSSHILSEVERTCDRLLMLRKGRIVAMGTEAELVEKARARPASYRATVQDNFLVRLELGGTEEQIREALDIAGIEIKDLVPSGEGRFALHVTTKHDQRAEIARAVVNEGVDLLGLERADSGRPGTALEEMFVRMSDSKEASP